jgi:hypothetical protein
MTPDIVYFILYLITVPDIESDQRAIHRIYFENFDQCEHYAEMLGQQNDPIVGQKNCVKVDTYLPEIRIPLRKPEFMK